MSAPPGWHPQPDGRERWWDGQQWTEHFRDPVAAPVPAYGDAGYAQPGGQAPLPQKTGMSSGAKGCLIAVVVLVVVAILVAIAGVFFFARSVNEAVDDVRTSMPTGFPTEIPEGTGTTVVVVIGDGFDVGGARVEDGWSLEENGGIGRSVEGMTATFADGQAVPLFFTMQFTGADGGTVDTVCSATGEGGATADVSCIPLFGDVDENGDVEVTSAF